MNKEATQRAIQYNRAQKYAVSTIIQIQRVTGSTPDATWGPRTVEAIAQWQAERSLTSDGKVGPNTLARIKAEEEAEGTGYTDPNVSYMMSHIDLGVWGDDPPAKMAKREYAEKLAELGVNHVALMMNKAIMSKHADPWDLRWKDRGEDGWHDDLIVEIAELYDEYDIRLVLTTWPIPSKAQIDEMAEAMVKLLTATGAMTWEVDVEGNWRTRYLDGFESMGEAGKYLTDNMRWTAEETEATTFGHHAELGRHPTVTPHVDTMCVQAYSVCERGGKPYPFNGYLGPGKHQDWIYKRAVKAGANKITMGLAAYEQGFPGRSPQEAMQIAFDKSIELGVRSFRYWSTKWILGVQSHNTPYAAEFLRSLQKK